MKELNEFIKIDLKKKSGRGRFKIIEFKDHDHFVTYLPSLNLSAYGDDKASSRKMMGDIILKDFFEHLLEQPESIIFDEFKKLGWERSSMFKRELSKSSHIDRSGILREFNLSEETVLEETLVEA